MNIAPAARRLLLIGVPLGLGLLELTHPIVPPEDVLHHMQPHATWWTILHIIQLPLFALLAFTLALPIQSVRSTTATVSRVGLAIFALFYGAFDAIAGIANGIIIQNGSALGHADHDVIEALVVGMFTAPETFTIMLIGILGWLTGLIGVTLILARRGAPRGALALLVFGGLLFGYMHAPPLGPAGLLLMSAALAWMEWPARPARRAQQAESGA
jgi:hypothetical protein